MSSLKIYDPKYPNASKDYETLAKIQNKLLEIDVLFERWEPLSSRTDKKNLADEEILNIYKDKLDLIKEEFGFQGVDIINVKPDFAQSDNFEPMRKKFLDEHSHTDDEVRYFIDGQGLFYIHHNDIVYGILCTAGDFISVPANTPHWFDMGSQPNFKCIRFFTTEEGWVPIYQDESISHQFPLLDGFIKAPV